MKMLLVPLLVLLAQARGPLTTAHAEYLIGPQDVLSILVHNHDELSRRDGVAVEADGTIEYPLIGRVKVGGLSTRQIGDDIKQKLIAGGYLTNASVSVSVKDYRSQSVHVYGEGVRTPGTVQLKGNVTLAEALSQAGSFSLQAGAYIIIARGGTPDSPAVLGEVKPENQLRILRSDIETGAASRIQLQDGDTIFVPRAEVYYVTGHVRNPNEFIFKPNLTVLQAITIAGGYTDRAAKNRLTVERMVEGRLDKVKVKESDLVQPGDTIRVPPRFW